MQAQTNGKPKRILHGVMVLLVVMLATLQFTAGQNVVFEWSSLLSRYPDTETGHLVKEHGIPFSLEVWQDMVFLTVPRWRSGVAASLSYVHLPKGVTRGRSPLLRPYPGWSWHNMHAIVRNSDALQNLIISPFRVRADNCNQLWVLDSGVADILGTAERIAPTRLLIFHVETRHLIHIAALPDEVTTEKSFHSNFVVDVSAEDCEGAFAYITDVGDPGLIVYNYANDTFWRISHPYFEDRQNISSYFTRALSSLALSTPVEGDPILYLQHGKLSVSSASLKAKDLPDVKSLDNDSLLFGASDMDKWTDILFYTQVMEKMVGCCNMMQNCTPDTEDYFNTTLYPSDVRLDKYGNLWILETHTPAYHLSSRASSAVKYRIVYDSVENFTKDLSCFNSKRKYFRNNATAKHIHNILLWIILSVTGALHLFNT